MAEVKIKKRAAKSKKGRKINRNRVWCAVYKASGRRERNKVKRVRKHLVRHPNDLVAKRCVENGGRRVGGL